MAKKPKGKSSGHPTDEDTTDRAMKDTHRSGKSSARKTAPSKKMPRHGRTSSY